MNEPTQEQIAAAGARVADLLGNFEGVIQEHFVLHPGVRSTDLECDVFTALTHLFTCVAEASGTPPLKVLEVLAVELGVKTITANSRSVGRG
jgi:hypothetical protein